MYADACSITLDAKGNGTGSLLGPRVGWLLRILGGTVNSQGAGNPSLTIHDTVASNGLVLAVLQVGASNNISGDGGTVLYPGQFPLVVVTGGIVGGRITVRLTGTLERF